MELQDKKLLKITGKVFPLWEKPKEIQDNILNQKNDGVPSFLTRTKTEYCKITYRDLLDRGVSNRLFEALIEILPEGCIISGGFMVNLLLGENKNKDIDIFCTSEKAFVEFCNLILNPPAKIEGDEDEYWPIRDYETSADDSFNQNNKEIRFLNFKHKTKPEKLQIQVMKMAWYDSPEHVIDTFDLTIVQIAADKDFIYMNPLTQFDLSSKKLVLHRMQFPASTIRRIIKYANRGYYACPGSLVNISKAIQEWGGISDINEDNFVYLD